VPPKLLNLLLQIRIGPTCMYIIKFWVGFISWYYENCTTMFCSSGITW